MKNKTAILLVLAMILSSVASPAFAAEVALEVEEVMAAEAFEVEAAEAVAEEAAVESSTAILGEEGHAPSPSGGGGSGPEATVWKDWVEFKEAAELDSVTLTDDTWLYVEEGYCVTVFGGITGEYELRKSGYGSLVVYGLEGACGTDVKAGEKGGDAISIDGLFVGNGMVEAIGGNGGSGGAGNVSGDGGDGIVVNTLNISGGAELHAYCGAAGSAAMGGQAGSDGQAIRMTGAKKVEIFPTMEVQDMDGSTIFENGSWADAFEEKSVINVVQSKSIHTVSTLASPYGSGFVGAIVYDDFEAEPTNWWESAPGHTYCVDAYCNAGYEFVKYQATAGEAPMELDTDGVFDMPAENVMITGIFEAYPVKDDPVIWGEAGKTTEVIIDAKVVYEKGVQLAGDVELTVSDDAELVIKEGLSGEGYDLTLKSGRLLVYGAGDSGEMGVVGSFAEEGAAGEKGADGTNGQTAIVCKQLTIEDGYFYAEGGNGGSGGSGGVGAAGGNGGTGGDAVVAEKIIVTGGAFGAYGGDGGKPGTSGMGIEGADPNPGMKGDAIVTNELVIPDDYYICDVHDRPASEDDSWADVVAGVQSIKIRPWTASETVTVVQDPAGSAVITLSTTNGPVEEGAEIAPGHRVSFDVKPVGGAVLDKENCRFTYENEGSQELILLEDTTFLMPLDDVVSVGYPVTLTFKFTVLEKKSEAKPAESEVVIEDKNEKEKEAVEEIVNNKADQTEALKTLEGSIDFGELVSDGIVKPGAEVVQSFDVKLKDVSLSETSEKKIVFEIKPVMMVTNAGEEAKQIIVDNKYLKKTVKVVVPVPANITEKFVKIRHIADDGTETDITPYPEIKDPGTDHAYFEVEVDHFSTFEVGFTDEQYVEPSRKESESYWTASSAKPYTGVPGNPVTGTWVVTAEGIWQFRTTAQFKNTWGYIVNPYAPAGLPKEGWFWFDGNGNMLTGWQLIGGKWYYLNPKHDGTFGMCQLGGVTPDGYKLNADGSWTGK